MSAPPARDREPGSSAPTIPLALLLDPQVNQVCQRLSNIVRLHGFVLCGGTAMGTYFGHRRSNDLDFFLPHAFKEEALLAEIKGAGLAATLMKSGINSQQLLLDIDGAKVDFVHWRGLDAADVKQVAGSDLSVPGLHQLAVMKTRAAAIRGMKRDVVDMFFLLRHGFDPIELATMAADGEPTVAAKFAKAIAGCDRRSSFNANEPLQMLIEVDWAEMMSTVRDAFGSAFFR